MHKEVVRKEALRRRKIGYSLSASAKICKKAASLPAFQNAKNVMIYLPTGTEVDTSLLLSLCRKTGKKVFAPRVVNNEIMEAALIDERAFQKGAFGIWEPLGKPADSLDLIFVPGVVFDKNRNRIGYGRGYYDRFLRNMDSVTVGLAFSCQIVPILPADAHDIKMDIVITEEGIIS